MRARRPHSLTQDGGGLGFGDGGWYEGVLDGIGVDAVVDLGEGAQSWGSVFLKVEI